MEILIRKKGARKWEKVGEKKFANEAALQHILYESPGIIPIETLGETAKGAEGLRWRVLRGPGCT